MRRKLVQNDKVGLGWRPELAASILSHLDQIDVVEVIIDNYFKASSQQLRSLQTLASQVSVIYHGVGLGIASSIPVQSSHLEKLARIFDQLTPEVWSEHLSFVRAGGIEIGHLAAAPRTLATIEGCLENFEKVKKIVGSAPVLENIATLIDPPGSTFSEGQWTEKIIRSTQGGLLLDLHNLYSNAVNFGFDPFNYLKSFPLDQVKLVHLSGGHWIHATAEHSFGRIEKRLLDDHVHDVPDEVFNLLYQLAELVEQPLTVIIERDGEYPEFSSLLNEIRRARTILEKARRAKSHGGLIECARI